MTRHHTLTIKVETDQVIDSEQLAEDLLIDILEYSADGALGYKLESVAVDPA